MNIKLKKEYNRVISKICKERLYLNTYITVTDNTRIEIENCKKILEYNDVYVKLRTATVNIAIWGQDLTVSDYNTDGIIVEGKFSSIEFE